MLQPILKAPETPEEWDAYYACRYATLRQPLGFPPGRYEDPTDGSATHCMAWDVSTGTALAVGRAHVVEAGLAQVRYMGVREVCRGTGLGRHVLQVLEAAMAAQGATTVGLNARDYAVPFYEKCGYAVIKPTGLLIADIPHYWMTKAL
jgi:GNAT superfamily N-acetyltransferase